MNIPLSLCVILLGLLSLVGRVSAASDESLQSQQKNLELLRGRIEALRQSLSGNEQARRKAMEEVKQIEQSMHRLQRELGELARQRKVLEGRLAELHRQSDEISQRIKSHQAQLEQTLYRGYLYGDLYSYRGIGLGEGAFQSERDSYYLSLLAHSRKNLVADFRQNLSRKERLLADVQTRTAELTELQHRQEEKQAELGRRRDRHQELVMALSGKVQKQKRQISALQENEKRLSQLVDRLLEKIARKPQRSSESATKDQKSPNTAAVNDLPAHVQLRLPVQGSLLGRFGGMREEGGNWKGLMIRAPKGTPVRSAAAGNVVFSGGMRGFGNLLVLDHGKQFLSIYGHNEKLHKKVGELVKSGEVIGETGSINGDGDYGLYFEVRRKGLPVDPLKWVNAQ